MRKITMLGTGHAMVTECYNTCFIIDNHGEKLLVDAGGGNGILKQFKNAGESFIDIRNIFITHVHTDHILGAVWVIRKIVSLMFEGKYKDNLRVYIGAESEKLLRRICEETLFEGYLPYYNDRVSYITISDGHNYSACGMDITVFDLHSYKLQQFGFKATFSDGYTLCCLGDEPINNISSKIVSGCDLLMSEAYCLYEDRDIFSPYTKRHTTVKDAAILASNAGARSLLLYHCEDSDVSSRKARYKNEAGRYFKGIVYVPDDLDKIEF